MHGVDSIWLVLKMLIKWLRENEIQITKSMKGNKYLKRFFTGGPSFTLSFAVASLFWNVYLMSGWKCFLKLSQCLGIYDLRGVSNGGRKKDNVFDTRITLQNPCFLLQNAGVPVIWVLHSWSWSMKVAVDHWVDLEFCSWYLALVLPNQHLVSMVFPHLILF